MTDTIPSIKESIMKVTERIRQTARSRRATELPTAEFSQALNAVGERFVDLLLQEERTGNWWLSGDGEWVQCTIKTSGKRCNRNFVRGNSVEWEWFPKTASRLADPMTGPDHVVTVKIPSVSLTTQVVLEQKLRFGTPQDAFANGATYVKHLLAGLSYPVPSKKELDIDGYCNGLLEAARAKLCKTKNNGDLAYSGSVPHVCFVSIGSSPHKIMVQEKPLGTITECDFVGFLAPSINQSAFVDVSTHRRIVEWSKVRLWIGLDSLLDKCDADEVENAWDVAIAGLTKSVRNPEWST